MPFFRLKRQNEAISAVGVEFQPENSLKSSPHLNTASGGTNGKSLNHQQPTEFPEFMRHNDQRRGDEEHAHFNVYDEEDDDSVSSASGPALNEIALAGKKAVQYSRVAMIVLLLVSAVGVAVFIYRYTDRSEIHNFETQFAEDARKVLEQVGTEWEFTLGAADAFLVASLTTARITNQTYPFVTTDGFALRAAKLRSLTHALVLSTYPLVQTAQREAWEAYSVTHDAWVNQTLQVQAKDVDFQGTLVKEWPIQGKIHGNQGIHEGDGPYFPTWESYPSVPIFAAYNWDIRLHYPEEVDTVMQTKQAVLGKTDNLPPSGNREDYSAQTVQWVRGYASPDQDPTEPLCIIYYPILERKEMDVEVDLENSELAGIFVVTLFWKEIINDILPPGSDGITVVFSNTCGQAFTYKLHGPNATYMGGGDLHETKYDKYVCGAPLTGLGKFSSPNRRYSGVPLSSDFCPYTMELYPSDEMKNDYVSSDPVIFTVVAVSIFIFTSLVFFMYDYLTQARQRRILSTALKNSAVVSSLFPQSFRDRVLTSHRSAPVVPTDNTMQGRLQTFLRNNFSVREESEASSRPIAEYFEESTVMFADIANFTAWSSVREPGQVFSLLENIYGAFDSVAKRRGAYKVETIGDSYVAVAGVPDPRPDHAVVMVRFAKDCRQMMSYLTRDLEITLGPGTGDLQMRFGLNSGPVTAGVLRGARSRFQLFGDTVNTAACMEGTGVVNKIHISQATADLLIANGKQHWITRRREPIEVKGKGSMQTYWVDPKYHDSLGSEEEEEFSVSSSASSSLEDQEETGEDSKTDRLVDWNVDILERLLRQVIANRDTNSTARRVSLKAPHFKFEVDEGSILDEFADVIDFTKPDTPPVAPDAVELPEHVSMQLRMFVKNVASLYQPNEYHNFEHSCHVSMSLVKLVSRVVGPDEDPMPSDKKCFGITCDPLAQFACIFAALVHDVQHPGVSNSQLIAEGSSLAQAFEFRSVVQQNAIKIIWDLLNSDTFPDLRRAICATQAEVIRFRQLLVNLVLATDTLDIDQRDSRDSRWERVFDTEATDNDDPDLYSSRATILAELLVQAADIGHTMQHWHIYRKWNEQLFEEMFLAHAKGRGDVCPGDYWYDAELAFFDDVVLPLARKLRNARIFGVSSEEYYNYAQRNREEWEDKGREVVQFMAEKMLAKFRSRRRATRGARMASIAE